MANPALATSPSPTFDTSTRRKILPLPAITKAGTTTGASSQSFQLPKVGLAARLYLAIRGTVASGGISAPNALGFASVITQVKLTANSGIDLINISGAGWSYLVNELLESEYFLAQSQNSGRSAVSATTYNIDMVLPLAANLRDPTGLILLQNEQTVVTCTVGFAADSAIATGVTTNVVTVTPYLEVFTVPTDQRAYPPLNQVHQILEDTQAVAASGAYTYNWPRGNVYLQVAHGLGIGASGTDAWSQYQLRLNQSDYLQSNAVDYADMEQRLLRGRARPAGGIFVDFLGTSGLGCYGKARDLLNSALITDLASVITATGAGTLYTVRRQLVALA